MKKALKNIFIPSKSHVMIRRTSEERILAFIEKLHPKLTDKPLIRLGSDKDGGYLVPDDLSGIEACFSPGVDKVSEFEWACHQLGMKLFMADKSVDTPNIDLPPKQYSFLKKFIGCTNNENFITLDNWVGNTMPGESDLLLQMDIEGDEYPVIINASPELIKRFRIMVIEFHSLHRLWNPVFFQFASLVFQKILETHTCVHIHPNNCCGKKLNFGVEIPRVAEFTFFRNDRFVEAGYAQNFPHPLDVKNTEAEELVLPAPWFRIT